MGESTARPQNSIYRNDGMHECIPYGLWVKSKTTMHCELCTVH